MRLKGWYPRDSWKSLLRGMPTWTKIRKSPTNTSRLSRRSMWSWRDLIKRKHLNNKRKYRKQVLIAARQQSLWHNPINFTLEDGEGVTYPYENALVISMILANHRVIVDDESSINILFRDVMIPIKNPLIGIEGLGVPVKGTLKLLVIIGTCPRCITL